MRNEIIASVITLKRLVKRLRLDPRKMTDIPLYVATSIPADTLEKEVEEIWKLSASPELGVDHKKRNELVFSMTNPLTALKTLSNANSCFASENCGARGNNATFGDTSNAGFSALEEAYYDIREDRSTHAFVGVGVSCGRASQLSLKGIAGKKQLQAEREAAVFLVLGCRDSIANIPDHHTVRIRHLEQEPFIPDILEHTGGHIRIDNEDSDDAFTIYSEPHGRFPDTGERRLNLSIDFGNLGAASLLCGIAFVQDRLRDIKHQRVVCVDKDIYGRRSWVELEVLP